MANADTTFSGSVPQIYTRYMGPIFFEPFAEDMARRIAATPGRDILETACGTGIVTRALCRALPDETFITATDLNQPMIDYAKATSGGKRVDWRQADAQNLPFEDATFDVAVTAFGVMFFPDKVGAFREVLRVLRPGGQWIFNVWNRLETVDLQFIAHTAVAALYPNDPPGFFRRTPCGYHEVTAIRADLTQAGFVDVEIETLDLVSRASSPRDAAIGLIRGTPISSEIAARDPMGLDAAVDAATRAIEARYGDARVEARMQAHVATARRRPE
jgi:SAM-dependent methyltransferase